MSNIFKREPAVVIAGITGLVTAGLGLGVAFGLPVTPEQQGAILGFTGAVLALVFGGAAVTRANVASMDNVVELVKRQPSGVPDEVVAGPANDWVDSGDTIRELPSGRHAA